ncbi:UNVERIFIED_CONTAM: hypothetical protein Sradi_0003000 [Sesamum radiatum]|uniref:Uncharacterized protein n=1 Tax=Sesamum radiatum TaxID=300843 RepID=A0AAW2WIZ1_SESRA
MAGGAVQGQRRSRDVLEAVGGTPKTREQQRRTCTFFSSLRPQTCSICRCQQLAAGKGAEYSVSAPRPTTQLLDHHSLATPLLLCPHHQSRRVTTCVIGCR